MTISPLHPVLVQPKCHPFFSSNATIFRQQLERLNAFKERRAGVTEQEEKEKKQAFKDSKIKDQQLRSHLGSDNYVKLKQNPKQYGLPRTFSLLLGGHGTVEVAEKLHDPAFYTDEGHIIHFAGHGDPNKGLWINSTWVPPEQIKLSADKMVYTFSTKLVAKDGGGTLDGYINFMSSPNPHGTIILNKDAVYAVQLKSYASIYDISVSKDAGATYSSGQKQFTWDPTSSQWQGATWETNAGIFGYDVINNNDPITPIDVVEFGFTDNKSVTPSQLPAFDFGCTADQYPFDYTVTLSVPPDNSSTSLVIEVATTSLIPKPSSARAAAPVASLFPQLALFTLDEFATSFTGAYQALDKTIYAIQGQAQFPFLLAKADSTPKSIATKNGSVGASPRDVTASTVIPLKVSSAPVPKQVPPPKILGTSLVAKAPVAAASPVKPVAHSAAPVFSNVSPVRGAFPTLSSATSSLTVQGLLNLNPMLPDQNNQWYDAVAQDAMNDFHDGILTFMESDLYNTFVGGARPALIPEVNSIINSNPTINLAFYQKLQVPFLTAALSTATEPSAKLLNGVRAGKMLQDLPANDPVYQSQSSALYAMRWKKMYPIMQTYLDDQAGNDYSVQITSAATFLKTQLASRLADVPDPTGMQAANLLAAQNDVDDLAQYAISNNLYWAFMLLTYMERYYLPSLQAKMTSGALSQSIAMEIKTLGAVFGILEAGGSGISPGGQSFQAVFNDMIRGFSLTVILPPFVDAEGNSTVFNEMIDAIIKQFISTYAGSSDPDIQQQVIYVTNLQNDQQAIGNLMAILVSASRLTTSLTSWGAIVSNMQIVAQGNTWYQTAANGAGLLGGFLQIGLVVMMTLPLMTGGGWDSMSPSQQGQIATNAAALFVTFTIKIARGILRLASFWQDVTPWTSRLKLLFGTESIIDNLEEQSVNIQNGFSKWLIRTTKQSMNLDVAAEDSAAVLRIFGRNASEFLSNTVGTVLGVVNIALAAWNLATTTDLLQKDLDTLNIVSASLGILGIAAGWISGSVEVSIDLGTVGTILCMETAAACLGPLSAAFAVAGIIVMIVMTSKPQTPPDPIKTFAQNQANAAGLYMPLMTAIDYLNVVPPNGASGQSLDGVAFENNSSFLQITQAQATTHRAGVQPTGSVTHSPSTCLNVQTSSQGITTIWTTTNDANNNDYVVSLAVDDTGAVAALPPPAKPVPGSDGTIAPSDAANYAKLVKQQQWIFTCTAMNSTVQVSNTTYLESATFHIQSNYSNAYLALDSSGASVVTSSAAQNWLCGLQTVGPSPFSYTVNPWNIYTIDRDMTIVPRMASPGSQPLTWTVTPPLPTGLVLRTDAQDGGAIAIVSGQTATATGSKEYTVKASIVFNTVTYFQTAKVTISITVPPSGLTSS